MNTLDDFFENAPNDDSIRPEIAKAAAIDPIYPDAPVTGRMSTCWTTMPSRPKIGQRVQAGRFWYVVSQIGAWEAADSENGIEEAGFFVRLISPAMTA